ncbi:hypothetical protein [Sphingomonas sp. CARO-RG-8B-R24-01]|uniref:hypothetical protein n=1 Tax=Sphingomonas sp. CARO-RG-8B-R24-01 TaxID=2914831 RepID=UPI001F595093|nr:hypothetical protein [Sphingomonas sp. CARO-RG-8B-R24-01]
MTPASATETPDVIALAERVSLIAVRAARAPIPALAAEIEAIRAAAAACGNFPAVAVTQAISAALERGERGALVQAWIIVLRDAVLSGRHDQRACDTYGAACSVRLAG